jgi:hypothetical protein
MTRSPMLNTAVVVAGTAAMAGLAGCYSPAGGQPVDVAASELSIQPAIIDSDPSPSDGKLPVIVQFYRGGGFVQLAGTSTVTCNGIALTWNGLGYAERVPVVAPGGTLAFVHVRGGETAQIAVTVPPRPVVTAPASGASVARTTNLAISYAAAASAGVRPGASDGTSALAGTEQPDTGTATIDVSQLHAGPGTIDISRRIVSTAGGTGFGAVSATYTISSASTHVTWR